MPGHVPAGGPVAVWLTAVLAGRCAPDEALDILGSVEAQMPEGLVEGWGLVVGRLRSLGVPALRLLLPVAGDLSDLPGPDATNRAALECGECVLAAGGPGVALLPVTDGRWRLLESAASRPVPGGPGPALRELGEAMEAGAADLGRLGLESGRDRAERILREADDDLASLVLPRDYPPRALQLITRGVRLRAAIAAASGSDGAAVTAAEAQSRARALAPLARAARRAVEAGFSAPPSA